MTSQKPVEETILELERLLDDLRRVEAGQGPTEQDLAKAPRLRDWYSSTRSVTCLNGVVIRHPSLGTYSITTSALFYVSNDLSWARTFNRFYRLSDRKFGDQNG